MAPVSAPMIVVRTCPVSCGWTIYAADLRSVPGFVPSGRDEDAVRDAMVAEHMATTHATGAES